ncbi:MAG: SLC13 family permease [Bacteroidales bacterium]|nr:SLC13 family permease [Bacteroidales bacterium]
MNITFIILFFTMIFFIHGKIRTDIIALCSLIALVLFDIISANEALLGFSSPVVIMMLGLFVVGAGIFRTGLAKIISSRILQLAQGKQSLLFILIILVTGFTGAFVSNTGTVAVMMPIVISLAQSSGISPKRYLMPLAFASSLGYFTLISTPPNLVVQEYLINNDHEPLGFFAFAPIGVIVLSIGLIYLFFTSKFLVKKKAKDEELVGGGKSLEDLAKEYNLLNKSYQVEVAEDSPIVGKTLAELKLTDSYRLTISKTLIRNGKTTFQRKRVEEMAGPTTVIQKGMILFCHGKEEDIKKFIADKKLTLIEKKESEVIDFEHLGIAEIYIAPNSDIRDKTLAETNFRNRYNVNVLGFKRYKEYRMTNFSNEKLHPGDSLLVQGTWDDIRILSNRMDDFIVVGQPLEEASKVILSRKAPIAAVIMILMVLAMVFDIIPSVIAILIAALLMVLTGCLRSADEAYRSINWESIVLIGAMLPMATAFEKTGIDQLISGGLIDHFGGLGPYALMAGLYLATSLVTFFVSNTATAVLFAPIAVQAAAGIGGNPTPFLLAVAVAASMCFASPFSTPPNAIVMKPGGYSFMDYVKIGLPLQIIIGVVMIMVLPWLFPF